MIYLQESNYNIGAENDHGTFSQVISLRESNFWHYIMKEEITSMACSIVLDLFDLPNGLKAIGCKWIFKAKKDSLDNIERYKTRLVAKGFIQNKGIDYKETFSHVSKKDSLCIIL